MCAKNPPRIESTEIMSPTIPKDPFKQAMGIDAYNQASRANQGIGRAIWHPSVLGAGVQSAPVPSKTTHITVTPVSNGFVIKVSTNSTTIERIVPDFENLGAEIMTALAEIQLGK